MILSPCLGPYAAVEDTFRRTAFRFVVFGAGPPVGGGRALGRTMEGCHKGPLAAATRIEAREFMQVYEPGTPSGDTTPIRAATGPAWRSGSLWFD